MSLAETNKQDFIDALRKLPGDGDPLFKCQPCFQTTGQSFLKIRISGYDSYASIIVFLFDGKNRTHLPASQNDARVYFPAEIKHPREDQIYQLKAVVHHTGSSAVGHFTAYVRYGDMYLHTLISLVGMRRTMHAQQRHLGSKIR